MYLRLASDYQGALDYFHRAQVLTPQYSFLLINLAIAEDATKQSELAEQHFREALRLAPGLPDAYSFYARFLLAHSRPAEARPLLQEAARLSPADQTVRDLLAKMLTPTSTAESYLDLSLQHYRAERFAESIAAAGDEIGPEAPGSPHMGLWVHDLDGYRWELSVQGGGRKKHPRP